MTKPIDRVHCRTAYCEAMALTAIPLYKDKQAMNSGTSIYMYLKITVVFELFKVSKGNKPP